MSQTAEAGRVRRSSDAMLQSRDLCWAVHSVSVLRSLAGRQVWCGVGEDQNFSKLDPTPDPLQCSDTTNLS